MIKTVGQLKKILAEIGDSKVIHIGSDPDSNEELFGGLYNINEYKDFIILFPVDVYESFIDLVEPVNEYAE
jgi:hypothetical protein